MLCYIVSNNGIMLSHYTYDVRIRLEYNIIVLRKSYIDYRGFHPRQCSL